MATVIVIDIRKGRRRQDDIDRRASARAGLQQNQNVVVVGFDVGLRNLDLVMGAERRVVFDLINVVQGDNKLPQALIPRQADRHLSHAARLADARQGCALRPRRDTRADLELARRHSIDP